MSGSNHPTGDERMLRGRRRRVLPRAVVAVLLAVAALRASPVSPASAETSTADCPTISATELRAPYEFWTALTEAQLRNDYLSSATGLARQGYRATRISGYEVNGQVRFALRMVKMAGPAWWAHVSRTTAQAVADIAAYKDSWKLVDINAFNTPAGLRYNLIWDKSSGAFEYYDGRTPAQMPPLIASQRQRGFAPVRVEGWRDGGGQLRLFSLWHKLAAPCDWKLESDLGESGWADHQQDNGNAGYRQVHVDATRIGPTNEIMRYHAIWWRDPAALYWVSINHDWYRLQARSNQKWCAGMVPTNVYGADNGVLARFGAIWVSRGALNIGPSSPIGSRIMEEVNCAQGRAGSAVVNLTTGQWVTAHADEVFGTSSTIKSAILYTLLKRVAPDGDLSDTENVGAQLGSNQGTGAGPDGGPLVENANYPLDDLVAVMIGNSNNWATNVILRDVLGGGDLMAGLTAVNEELEALGLTRTKLNRYFTGPGAPSPYPGSSGPSEDYRDDAPGVHHLPPADVERPRHADVAGCPTEVLGQAEAEPSRKRHSVRGRPRAHLGAGRGGPRLEERG
jgi:hypothetical protein